jgi:predicted alpha/beta-fold hydrolase
LFSAYGVTQETLNNINHDTFIYSAYDDPCVPIEPLLELEETTNVKFNALKYGGHCGFIDDFKFTSSVYYEIAKKLQSNTH